MREFILIQTYICVFILYRDMMIPCERRGERGRREKKGIYIYIKSTGLAPSCLRCCFYQTTCAAVIYLCILNMHLSVHAHATHVLQSQTRKSQRPKERKSSQTIQFQQSMCKRSQLNPCHRNHQTLSWTWFFHWKDHRISSIQQVTTTPSLIKTAIPK